MLYVLAGTNKNDLTLQAIDFIKKYKVYSFYINSSAYVFADENGLNPVFINDILNSALDDETFSAIAVKLVELSTDKNIIYSTIASPIVDKVLRYIDKSKYVVVLDEVISSITKNLQSYNVFALNDFIDLPFFTYNRTEHLIITGLDNIFNVQLLKSKLFELLSPTLDVTLISGNNVERYKLEDIDTAHDYSIDTTILITPQELITKERYSFNDLLEVIYYLRGENGCPWDKAQTHKTIRANAVEEAYELEEAIDLNRIDKMLEESGDVLLQAVFHSTIAESQKEFTTHDMLTELTKKLINRHTHIFGNTVATNPDSALASWENAKAKEKKQTTLKDKIDSIAYTLPSVMQAYKLQKIASKVGFDWDNAEQCSYKIDEELQEFLSASDNEKELEGGDLLFSAINVLRLKKIDPEIALKRANKKFADRFIFMEDYATKHNIKLNELTLKELDEIWEIAKNNLQ